MLFFKTNWINSKIFHFFYSKLQLSRKFKKIKCFLKIKLEVYNQNKRIANLNINLKESRTKKNKTIIRRNYLKPWSKIDT